MKHKVLFFIETLSGGGAEKVLVTLLEYLNYDKFDITLLLVNEIGVHIDDIKKMNLANNERISIKSLCGNGNSIYQKVKYKLIYHILPAWIVCRLFIPKGYNTYVAFVEGFCTKILSYVKGKKIAWVHIDLNAFPWTINNGIYTSKEKEQNAYNKYETVVCVSRSVEEMMRYYYKLKNTIVVYNPIDITNILQAAKKEIVEKNSAFNIISVGRLVVQKGYDLLIPIIARLQLRGFDVNLYIIGEGGERKALEKLIEELRVENRVHLLGYIVNPYPYIKQADLFVCSSRAEGYSLAVAEALTLGVPVVSTWCSGPNELLGYGQYGILCDGYEQLEEMIALLIKDQEKYEQLKKKTVSHMDRFDIQHTINQIEKILI